MNKVFFSIIIYLMYLNTNAQTFNLVPDSLTNFNLSYNADVSQAIWADYNNDGNLDLIINAQDYNYHHYKNAIFFYKNLGNDSFAIENYNFPYIGGAYISLGDYDNDGDIDILYSGDSSSVLYKNTLPDSMNFVQIYSSFQLYYSNKAQLVDIDNDGDLDVLYSGISYNPFSLHQSIYVNGLYGSPYYFYWYSSFFEQNYFSRAEFTDFNKDGYLDIISNKNKYYSNNKTFNYQYTYKPDVLYDTTYRGSYSYIENNIIDLNNDGYLDVTQVGRYKDTSSQSSFHFKVKNNLGSDSFMLADSSYYSGLQDFNNILYNYVFFDSNNNGFLDFIYSDSIGIYLYKNNNLNFTMDSSFNSYPYYEGIIFAHADYDNDGDLDYFVFAKKKIWPWGQKALLYKNDSTPPNNPPTKPEVLWTAMDSTKIIFHWNQATDVETPQAALGYNVMVGTSPNGIDIVSPLSDTATGFRKVVRLGNAQLNDFFILDKSKFNIGDTLYWRVQTLDNSHGYSPFSQSQMTVVCNRIDTPVFDTICSNDSLLWRGDYYSQTGRFKKTYGASQCDSTFFLDLNQNPAYINQQTVDICAGNTYSWNGNNYYVSGTYTQNHTTTKGCDSSEKLVLNVRQTYTNILSDSICIGDSIQIGQKWISDEGYYIDTLNSIHSCDSIIWLDLKTNPDDTNIIVQGTKLIGQDFSASYRWLDCDAQLFIPGANKRVFSPYLDGNYAAEISLNGCSYLTKCYSITGTGIRNLESSDIKIFPNPTESFVIIKSQNQQISKIELKSIDGKVLKIIDDINSTNQKIDLNSFEKGIYIFQIWVEGEVFYYKVLRQ